MPSYILRVDHSEPAFYVMWSTVVDDITAAGTKEELQASRRIHGQPHATADERFARADQRGTSDMDEEGPPYLGAWDDKGFVCQQKWLPRHRLRSYAENLLAGGDGHWLLEHINDDGTIEHTVTNDTELDAAVRKVTGEE